ncbi:alanine--tRNA ligase [Mesoplasma coleopterae]|uniref:Alanine--tRNA ligase n=1 Tax=Mesoplasma coleopterae TaxID=324078 RepID=A0A2K8P319_9MOLU|nr:alanine--tRNA ligase [Mesoplasma coleopterae]ATZ21147.1 alanyl-tRNA synthetase [Mesoplasma coleopterae]AVN63306.1 alanine--tRNA ligase [Mesoplasma coleopterae]
MRKLTTNEIRKMWLDFFKEKKHHFLEPVSLIPVEDPSLLWINSGVATLKPYFDGRKTPPSPRLTNSQKAIRTNDIENVGVTARHHTMFEMLGNFSIGDYFKKEAISFAWELLTSDKWFAIPTEKLYITVFDEDIEAYEYWINDIGIKQDHIFRLTRDTNFWDVGQGPCGPNTEIFFDRGEKWDKENIGPKLLAEDIENDRYIEIWNIVFSQFNNDGFNNYSELPRKNIDTGAGLERIASIFQDTPTNFETDIFWPTIKQIESICDSKFKYSIENYFDEKIEQTKINTAFKVIADHVRATSFAIADGVFPGNKDRGYIIRRLIRRALMKGMELGINGPFLSTLVINVINAMKDFYPYLLEKQNLIESTILNEEEKFLKTLSKGYEALNKMIENDKKVTGKNALLLFESFGYPIEQTIEIAEDKNVKVDIEEFNYLLEQAKEQARNARKDLKAWDKQNEIFTKIDVDSEFTGWEETKHENAKIVYIFTDDEILSEAADTEVYVILDKTPFYAEKGGQAADTGYLVNNSARAEVIDTQQGPNHQHIHKIQLEGSIKIGDTIDAFVNETKRTLTMKNHSGTHLIHAALREILGETVMQSGSYNDEYGLRMDFTYNDSIKPEELLAAEKLVVEKINEKISRNVYFCSMQDAISKYGALAFFTEKYDDIVRVVKFGEFSSELCGGTHVDNTHDIEDFMITGLESKGSGVYRVKCLTSKQSINEYLNTEFNKLLKLIQEIFAKYENTKSILADQKIEDIIKDAFNKEISKQSIISLKLILEDLSIAIKVYERKVEELLTTQKLEKFKSFEPKINENGTQIIEEKVNGLNIKDMKTLVDEYKNKFEKVIIILTSENTDGNFVVVGVSEKLQLEHSAIEIFKNLPISPKGGGNASLAQGKF